MAIFLKDDLLINNQLLPLTFLKPVSSLMVGGLTILEKWQYYFKDKEVRLYDNNSDTEEGDIIISSHLLPDSALLSHIKAIKPGNSLTAGKDAVVIAYKNNFEPEEYHSTSLTEYNLLTRPWDLFIQNGSEIAKDLELKLDVTADDVYAEPSAIVKECLTDTTNGPIYIGHHVEIMQGAMLQGPLWIGDYSVIKMGAKIYGGTSFGPHCKAGGEISNSVFQGFSNKAHDGYLGNSVIGEWCNLGADTNCSNLKNNYGNIKAYSYTESALVETGLQFCGLIMGDHTKTGINTMFNTGTVTGISCNLFGSGFLPKYIPSFSWGGFDDTSRYRLEQAIETAERMMARRNKSLTEEIKLKFRDIHTSDET